MGRPSNANKRAKRKRQKERHSNSNKLINSKRAPAADACPSPLLFSDDSLCTINDDTAQTSTCNVSNSALGDADTDLLEMELYDLYREEDGELHTVGYLQKCNEKLRTKVCEDKIMINRLQRENVKMKADKKMK